MNVRVSKWSGKKYRLFAVLTVVLSVTAALVVIELGLHYLDQRIAQSEQMEPGFIGFDAELGWALTPDWSGSHRHHDFDVIYNIARSGFRNDETQRKGSRPRVIVVGDSFTFGLGVNDNETFVAQLNAADDIQGEFINLGVPGYSTDQELILLQHISRSQKPDVILLVVYLGNDLFDNTLGFPLQAEHAKPFFSLDRDGNLRANNRPVPRASKPAAAHSTNLAGIVLGDDKPHTTFLQDTFGNTHLARRLGLFQQRGKIPEAHFQKRFDTYIRLFIALLEEIQKKNWKVGAKTIVALLPGASYINQPQSLSAQYQEYLLGHLAEAIAQNPDVGIIDLATAMQRASGQNPSFYFPNEGHLNPHGHHFVAQILARKMSSTPQ